MVLSPILSGEKSEPASSVWTAVEQRQKQPASEYWLVTQPSHAKLAGDLAAALDPGFFGPIDATVARAIALHDSGWSLDDAEQIHALRTNPKRKPASFLEADAGQFLRAWTESITVAEKFAPLGGYIVSRHFERLSRRSEAKDPSRLEMFQRRENQRQTRLRKHIDLDDNHLEQLVDALQFCDVLSLYLCCGSTREVRLDRPKIQISKKGDEYFIEPSPFRGPTQFSFSALRHPALNAEKGGSGATFYINL
jgi:hypothetical protein